MDEERNADSLRDELAREIERAFDIDPAPALRGQVRARIDRERTRHGWWLRGRLMSVGAGALALGIVVVLAVFRAAPAPVPVLPTSGAIAIAPAASPRPPAADRLARTGEERPVRPSSPSPASRPRPTVRLAARVEPQVLIRPDEAGALRRFAVGVREGQIDPSVFNDMPPSSALSSALSSAPLAALREIAVPPITIGSLARLEPLEGER